MIKKDSISIDKCDNGWIIKFYDFETDSSKTIVVENTCGDYLDIQPKDAGSLLYYLKEVLGITYNKYKSYIKIMRTMSSKENQNFQRDIEKIKSSSDLYDILNNWDADILLHTDRDVDE